MLLDEVRICGSIFLDNGLAHLIEEGSVYTQESAVARRSSEQAAKDIAPALV